MRAIGLLALAAGSVTAQKVLPPANTNGTAIVVALVGRNDAADGAYESLLGSVQSAAASQGLSVWGVTGGSFDAMASAIAQLRKDHTGARVFYAGHGMADGGGEAAASAALTDTDAAGVVLIAGFLQRKYRPSIVECGKTWSIQPTHHCPSHVGLPLCPGGYMKDHVHDCPGPAVPAPDYKLPTLTVGGGLDGVVRVARIAEAWYTQKSTSQHEVALVEGMNHADLMNPAPSAVTSRDLTSELGADKARSTVGGLIAAFLKQPGKSSPPSPAEYFAPFEKMFVGQEGNWWWTSNFDESGGSPWAGDAQRRMAEPVPEGYKGWKTTNIFHLLSDEEGIPPYYRQKHRANVTVQADKSFVGFNVAQLRYVELSCNIVSCPILSENGYDIIKEEKAAIINSIKDDGVDYTSAIEIATKMSSRQFVFNETGAAAPDSLDSGDRCAPINQAAYELAIASASPAAQARFNASGRPLKMVSDHTPTPNGGPWFIWGYLQYNDKGAAGVEIQATTSFTPLDGLAYGAGTHYCKLLSPARALEWVYTDGLRK